MKRVLDLSLRFPKVSPNHFTIHESYRFNYIAYSLHLFETLPSTPDYFPIAVSPGSGQSTTWDELTGTSPGFFPSPFSSR
jgi:hypothetical protein